MSFVLLIIGGILLIASVRGTQDSLFALAKGDFTGSNNFIYWTLSILIIGAVGYIPKLKPISVAFLTLVIIVLVLSKGDPTKAGGGFFTKFFGQVGSTQAAVNSNLPGAIPTASPTTPYISSLLG
jgi:hypothetical protein